MWATAALLCTTIAASYTALNYSSQAGRLRSDYQVLLHELEGLTITIDLKIDYGEEEAVWHNGTRVPIGADLLTATRLISDVESQTGEFGDFITKIDGVGGDSDRFWLWYYYDGEAGGWQYGPVGSDQWVLHDGDVVSWEYSSF